MTYLYRLLDEQGHLLYIGITNGPIYRLFQHLEEKPWAPQIKWQEVQQFNTREEALVAEKTAIECERPLYNIQFNTEEQAFNVREMYARHRQELFDVCRQYGIPKDASLSPGEARQLVRKITGQIYRFTYLDWQAWCQEDVTYVSTGRQFILDQFERFGVPKDASLSVSNARALARSMCGSVPNFSREDWDAWCSSNGKPVSNRVPT